MTDSVGEIANIRVVEESSSCRIRFAKATTSERDINHRGKSFREVVEACIENPG